MFATLILIAIIGFMVIPKVAPQFGAASKGERLEQIEHSPNYSEGKFVNLVDTPMNSSSDSIFSTFLKFIRGVKDGKPDHVIETTPFEKKAYSVADSAIQFTWFGHSTVLLKIEGKNLLIDPVFSNHTSPFSFMGPQAFPYSNTYALEDMPEIDAVLISHDHYDHLDYETFLQLKSLVKKFYVPLGLGAHLERWGIPTENITELDWWDEVQFDEDLLFACVPMRHFSGRGVTDRFNTLWAGWVIKGTTHSVIHTGDSGYGDHFKKIGDTYGPFDVTMVECGQYNQNWRYIHMMPEETVQAHIDLKGKYLLPIHWGRFNLSLHSWTDPVVRATKEAKKKNVDLISPIVGQVVTIRPPLPKTRWWMK